MEYTFGKNLKRIRKRKNLTQAQLADLVNISQVTLCRYERSDSYPNIDLVYDLATALGVKAEELVREYKEPLF